MNKIAFGLVVYEASFQYIDELINSINAQTAENFDVIIINDDVDIDLLQMRLSMLRFNYRVFANSNQKSPEKLRVDLIKKTKMLGYEILVIGDSDDLFSNNRISLVNETFEKNPQYYFYYNELRLFDEQKALGEIPSETASIEDIFQFNYLGLSNNTINLTKLSDEFIESLNECNTFVFDWYLFSRILCINGKGLLVPDAVTYYRIGDNNFAGFSNQDLSKEYAVKKKHYELMKKYNNNYEKLLVCMKQIEGKQLDCYNKIGYWWDNIIFKLEED